MPQSGSALSTPIYSKKLAKPSLSQRSSHQSIVTMFPNHWKNRNDLSSEDPHKQKYSQNLQELHSLFPWVKIRYGPPLNPHFDAERIKHLFDTGSLCIRERPALLISVLHVLHKLSKKRLRGLWSSTSNETQHLLLTLALQMQKHFGLRLWDKRLVLSQQSVFISLMLGAHTQSGWTVDVISNNALPVYVHY